MSLEPFALHPSLFRVCLVWNEVMAEALQQQYNKVPVNYVFRCHLLLCIYLVATYRVDARIPGQEATG